MDIVNLLLPLLIVATFYLLIWKPNQDAQKNQKTFMESLKKGMDVVTTSGIYGKINKIEENAVHLQVDSKTYIKFAKTAISYELTKNAFADNEKAEATTA